MPSCGGFETFRRLSDAKGANLVEAAIITPLLLLLTLCIVDFSAMFYCYLALEHGVSQATRYAVTGQEMSTGGTPIGREASIKSAMRELDADADHPGRRVQLQLHAAERRDWSGGARRPERRRPGHRHLHLELHDAAGPPFFTNGQINLRVQSTMKNEAVFQ